MPTLHATTIIERCISAERAIKEAIGELSGIDCNADYLLEEAAADVSATLHKVAARYGDDHFPARSAEAVLRDHDYTPIVATSGYLNRTPRTLEQARADLKAAE